MRYKPRLQEGEAEAAEKKMTMRQLNKYTERAVVSPFLGFTIDAYDMAPVVVMAPILTKLFCTSAWRPVLRVYSHRFSVFDHDGCATSGLSSSSLFARAPYRARRDSKTRGAI